MKTEILEYIKICVLGLAVAFGFYFLFEIPMDFKIPEVQADMATTSVTVGNATPTVSAVSLNAGADITVTENTTVNINCAATLSDNNGGSDVTAASSTIYRSGAGFSCSADNNNCYQLATSSCTLGTVVGNDRPATCTTAIYFHADPTATTSPWASEIWSCRITAIDSGSLTGSATNTAQAIEMNILNALDFSSAINYGTFAPGSGNASTSVDTTATTTGNSAIDTELSGNNMTSGADTLAVGQQHYATSTVAYASGIALTTTTASFNVDLIKPTTSPSNSTDIIYWGIQIPSGQAIGTYTGTSTVNAITAL